MTEPAAPSSPPPSASALSDAIDRLARTSVLVLGDAMLDRTVTGMVERNSPEAPATPVLRIGREIATLGGAGNVVRNLTALGAAVAFVSVVGDDQAGADLTGLIGGQPNVEPWLLVQGGRTTTRKTRYMAGDPREGVLRQLLRADQEETGPIDAKLAERLVRIAGDALAATSVTLLSDYGKGVLCGDIPRQIIAAGQQLGRKVIVDPRGTDYSRYAGADLITPNRQELADATGQPIVDEAGLVQAAQQMRTAHGFKAVLVTRGADGMTLLDDSGPHHIKAHVPMPLDVSGVGDTVSAALAAALAAGISLKLAAELANLAAGHVVTQPGIAVARPDDLRAMLRLRG